MSLHSLIGTRFEWAALRPDQAPSLAAIEGLLASSYGGDRKGYRVQYEPTFLHRHAFATQDPRGALLRGVAAREDGALVAFVAAVPTPVWYRGVPDTITLVNLWCARADIRGTGIAHALLQRLVHDCDKLDLAAGALFTGSRLHFPIVQTGAGWVRVLKAQPLIAAALLHPAEEPVASLPGLMGLSLREPVAANAPAMHALHLAARDLFDVFPRYEAPDALLRAVTGDGLRSWVIEDEPGGAMVAWFALSTSIVRRASGDAPVVRVANMWAFGVQGRRALGSMIAAATVMAARTGHHLLESLNGAPLSKSEAQALALRPGPMMNLHTYGSPDRYRGLSISLPLF